MSGNFQYSPYRRLENPSDSDAHLTESIKSEGTGQKLIDLSWAAGLLDGEACFRIDKRGGVRVAVDSTSKSTVERLFDILGGSCSVHSRRTAAGRPVFHWRVNGKEAVSVCILLIPFLVEKKRQAELLSIAQKYPPKSAMRKSIAVRLSELKRTV